MLKVYIINGPNMNLLGQRETEIYGNSTLEDIKNSCLKQFNNIDQSWFQSQYEGAIIEKIHEALSNKIDAIVINPAAYSHYSIAILDALKSFEGFIVEVHLSDILTREEFRRSSLTSLACDKLICGMGGDGYIMALQEIVNHYIK